MTVCRVQVPARDHMTDVTETFRYTEAEKQQFVEAYFEHGSLAAASRVTGVNYETAKYWNRQDWFVNDLARVKETHDRALETRLNALINKGVDKIEDILDKGEDRLSKTGQVIKGVKPPLASVVMATGVLFDKREKMRGTTVTMTPENVLEKLAEKLRALGARPAPEVVEVTFKEISGDQT